MLSYKSTIKRKKCMKRNRVTQYSLFLLFSINLHLESRLFYRTPDLAIPSITVRASDQQIAQTWHARKTKDKVRIKPQHTLKNPYLRINPIKQVQKGFSNGFFKEHYLPSNQTMQFRNKKGSVNSDILSQQAQDLVAEIKAGQRHFTDFKILKDRDFNYKQLSGLLVVKYKDYPFVLKLAIEHPHTLVNPYAKSFEAKFVFIVGGNIRHLSNFTRISNLENIKKIVMFNPYYLKNIDFPRKWYWQPENNYNLEITWNQSPYRDEEIFIIPSMYGVISDYIDIDPTYPQTELNKIAMKVAIDTDFLIDPHAGNVVVEKGSTQYTMLDTENFRIMTGLDHTMNSQKYFSWFCELSTDCLKVYAGRTKQERIRQCFSCEE